ncbi:MAG: DUF1492 domain-containing protein [Oscillospiraceae bacterium]|nr:DUF1492 domain-containing protein [Oscillospiraceae bacterium]
MEKKIYGVEAFLNRPKALEEEIRGDIDHIASLRSIVEKTTTQMSFTAGRNPSKNEKAFENVMIQIAEEEAALEAKQKRLVELKLEVENFISRLHKKEYSMILRHRYMEGLEMSSIMMLMHLAKTTAYDLLADALKAAAKLYAE